MDLISSNGSVMTFVTIAIALVILFTPSLLRNSKTLSIGQIGGITLTLGITGTFFGVFIGLLNFDTLNIEDSVPELLNGLKLAFLTSLAGLIANIITKINPKLYGLNQPIESDDVGEEIVRSLKSMENENKAVSESIKDLTKSISSDKDTSLVTQIQKIRAINTDGFENMTSSFKDFAEKMVADNTQNLIDALTDVMKDFNAKINEQFGENFKELNSSVKLMVEWQKEYKTQVEELIKTYDLISKNMENVDKTLSSTSESHLEIIKSNKELNDLVKDFSSMVNSFSELGDKASSSLPIIEKNMDQIVSKADDYINTSLTTIASNYDEFSDKQQQVLESYNTNLEKMITSNAERVTQLDEELGNELKKSLDSLGNSLGTLSDKFASDYGPITEKLKKIIDSLDIK
jgi:methyl-accepting chemotaxis protein